MHKNLLLQQRRKFLLQAESDLQSWIDKLQGYRSYDPIDYTGHFPYFAILQRSHLRGYRLLYLMMRIPFFIAPVASRKILGVKKKFVCTGAASLLRGFLKVWKEKKDTVTEKRIHHLAKKLVKDCISGYSGACWGLPYRWPKPNGVIWPRYFPNAHSTVRTASALWQYAEVFDDLPTLELAISASRFLIEDLIWSKNQWGKGEVCSYSPEGPMGVINVWAHTGAFLSGVAEITKDRSVDRLAGSLIEACCSNQRRDGLWNYYAGSDKSEQNSPDVYHNAMILEGIMAYKGKKSYSNIIENGFKAFFEAFIDEKRGVTMFPKDYLSFNISGLGDTTLMIEAAKKCSFINEALFDMAIKKFEGALYHSIQRFRRFDGSLFGASRRGIREDFSSLRWGNGTAWESLIIMRQLISKLPF
jgi:hypothetical protein